MVPYAMSKSLTLTNTVDQKYCVEFVRS